MKKYIILVCCCVISLFSFAKNQILSSDPIDLFIAIAQGNAQQVEFILNHETETDIAIQRDGEGNSPLMEAIIALGEKLMEIEAEALAKELPGPSHMTNDFRSFLRSFMTALIVAISTSEIQTNVQSINNDQNSQVITLLKSITNAFFPVLSRGAYIWCAYALIDYGIATGQKKPHGQSGTNSGEIEKYTKTIDLLLARPIDIHHINYQGESALSLIRHYKNKLKMSQLKIILYQIEQALLKEGAHPGQDVYNHVQNYSQKTE